MICYCLFTTISMILVMAPMKEKDLNSRHASADLINMVVKITNVDDGIQSLSSENSHLIIKTTSIDEVVKGGSKNISILLEIMQNGDVDFDLFARCYSACDQIIRKQNTNAKIYWTGGCKSQATKTGISRLLPGGQENLKDFRRAVCDSIKDSHITNEKK